MLSQEHRIAGVLVPVFALRGRLDLGIGDTAALMEFVDWAAVNGFQLVKLLPINETGGDHSPYNAISSRALDPMTIHATPGALPELSLADFDAILREVDRAALASDTVNYAIVKPLKRRLLEKAFERFEAGATERNQEFAGFVKEESDWLEDYALYRMLMEENGGSECWDHWPEAHRSPEKAREWLRSLPAGQARAAEARMRFFRYVQWIAFSQWREVKRHADGQSVGLMGDIPFGVSYYSSDVWAHPRLFKRDWSGGTPPDRIFKHDAFVQKWGQNWGIPLYDWEAMRADGFHWWRQRVHGVREFFDLFRIDHVLGFYRIYSFPWRPERNGEFLPLSEAEAQKRTDGRLPHFEPRADDTPKHKQGNRRDGEEYLKAVLAEAGAGRVIGEDLGEVPDYVRPSLTSLGIAGYKIPAWEKRRDGSLIPGADYEHLSLATYGTHDHPPLRAMWEQLAEEAGKPDGRGALEEMRRLWHYAGFAEGTPPKTFTPGLHEALLNALFQSNSWIAVVMITDLFGRSERFNLPGVASGNWTRRLHAPVSELDREPILPTVRELLKKSHRSLQAGQGNGLALLEREG